MYDELTQIDIKKMQEEIDRLKLMLQMAYCQKTGADTPDGLDCCDDYRDWLATLTPNAKLTGGGAND